MALVSWEPFREITSLQSEMNRLFNTFFDSPTTPGGNGAAVRRWVPAMDLVETEGHFVLRADLPGLSEEDVAIELEDNVLTVAGERQAEHEDKREGFYRLERSSGQFRRSLTLPDGIDPEAIEARFDKGVLEVRIPKPEERKPRRVAIQVGEGRSAIEGSESGPQAA
jgi:HSP20 family protein